jgi:hypothetical protein
VETGRDKTSLMFGGRFKRVNHQINQVLLAGWFSGKTKNDGNDFIVFGDRRHYFLQK